MAGSFGGAMDGLSPVKRWKGKIKHQIIRNAREEPDPSNSEQSFR